MRPCLHSHLSSQADFLYMTYSGPNVISVYSNPNRGLRKKQCSWYDIRELSPGMSWLKSASRVHSVLYPTFCLHSGCSHNPFTAIVQIPKWKKSEINSLLSTIQYIISCVVRSDYLFRVGYSSNQPRHITHVASSWSNAPRKTSPSLSEMCEAATLCTTNRFPIQSKTVVSVVRYAYHHLIWTKHIALNNLIDY